MLKVQVSQDLLISDHRSDMFSYSKTKNPHWTSTSVDAECLSAILDSEEITCSYTK